MTAVQRCAAAGIKAPANSYRAAISCMARTMSRSASVAQGPLRERHDREHACLVEIVKPMQRQSSVTDAEAVFDLDGIFPWVALGVECPSIPVRWLTCVASLTGPSSLPIAPSHANRCGPMQRLISRHWRRSHRYAENVRRENVHAGRWESMSNRRAAHPSLSGAHGGNR